MTTNVGGHLFAGFGSFQLDIILIGHQVGRHQDATLRQNRAESRVLKTALSFATVESNRMPGRSH